MQQASAALDINSTGDIPEAGPLAFELAHELASSAESLLQSIKQEAHQRAQRKQYAPDVALHVDMLGSPIHIVLTQ